MAQIVSTFFFFDCWLWLCIVGLTVIQDVSLCSCCLCLENAGRDRDFRQRRKMKGGYRRGSALEKGPTFTTRWKTVYVYVSVCVCACVNPQPQPQTALCVTFIHIKRSKDTYVVRYRKGRPPSLYPFPLCVSVLAKMTVILLCIIKSTLSQ